MRYVYTSAALANTSTVTNIGNVKVEEDYQPYIKMFYAFLAMSKGQNIKGTICSYQDTLAFTFSSVLKIHPCSVDFPETVRGWSECGNRK